MGAVTHSFHKNARRAESLTHVGVVQHVKSFCITKPWPINAKVCQNHSWSKKALKDIFHLITFGLRRSSSIIPSSRTGTSCNTCRSAVRPPRSSAIRWNDNQPGLENFKSGSYRPGPWICCLRKALNCTRPSSVSDVWGKIAGLLPENRDQYSMIWHFSLGE